MKHSGFYIPASSFPQLKKIIHAYAQAEANASCEDIAKLAATAPTVVSGNNRFLIALGLITGGQAKTITDLGRRLGRAIEHKQVSDTVTLLREAISTHSEISQLISTLRIKGSMTPEGFTAHILYVSGKASTANAKTGAHTIFDMLTECGLVQVNDDKVTVSSSPGPVPAPAATTKTTPAIALPSPDHAAAAPASNSTPTPAPGPRPFNLPAISINIQLHIPESDNPEVYESLFKALKKHLVDHDRHV